MSKIKEGDVFGYLTVLYRDADNEDFVSTFGKKKKIKLVCKCVCGTTKSILAESLASRRTKSCGCLRVEKNIENIKHCNETKKKNAWGVGPFNCIYAAYRSRSKKNNIDFTITKDELREYTKKECFYCGRTEVSKYVNKRHPDDYYLYNGLDRIDLCY